MYNPGFESSSTNEGDSDRLTSGLELEQSPFDVIFSYSQLESEAGQNKENPGLTSMAKCQNNLAISQEKGTEDLISYYEESETSSIVSLGILKASLCDSLTDSAIDQYKVTKPENPTIKYLKEESRRENNGRLSNQDEVLSDCYSEHLSEFYDNISFSQFQSDQDQIIYYPEDYDVINDVTSGQSESEANSQSNETPPGGENNHNQSFEQVDFEGNSALDLSDSCCEKFSSSSNEEH